MSTTVAGRRTSFVRTAEVGVAVVLIGSAAALVWSRSRTAAPAAPGALEIGPAVARMPSAEALGLDVRFVDITERSRVTFQHVNGAFGKRLLPETLGSGVAFIDYDKDFDQDLLLVNSCHWPGYEPKDATSPTMGLFRNEGGGRFVDATNAAGLAVTMYGMGVTVGDYDNDGWPDLFIAGVGGNRLFHNTVDGRVARRFVDRTESAGVGGRGRWPDVRGDKFLNLEAPINFSSSAAFLDYDGDAKLDLFVCNYVTWSPSADLSQGFQLVGLGRSYGPPTAFEGAQCVLYRNLDGQSFEDVSAKAGIQVRGPLNYAVGKALGVVVCDPDEDGWPDIIVANDTVRNFFFHNTGRAGFDEIGEMVGVAYAEGKARGAMGIDWGEYRPGVFGLLIGSFADEPNTLLRLDDARGLLFSDVATSEGLAGPSRGLLKFGALLFDYDLDGRQDILTCNGHLEPEINKVQVSQFYRQPAQLFWNTGNVGKVGFVSVSEKVAGPDLFAPIVGRSCADGDIDNDGDLDLVLTENNGPARILRNEGGNRNPWIRFVLEGDGRRSSRSALGARIVVQAAGVVQQRELTSARGYLSQSESVATFGLGQATVVARATIRWPGPDGGELVMTNLASNRVYHVRQGSTK
jgi:hypothetical protein